LKDRNEITAVSDAIRKAAARGEHLAGWIRIVIVTLALMQFLWFHGFKEDAFEGPRVPLVTGSLVVILVLSTILLKRLSRVGPTRSLLTLSVAIDCIAVVSVLWPTAMWPEAGYDGLLNLPNLSFFVVAIFVSAFRLDPRLTVASFLFSGVGIVYLLYLDHRAGLEWGSRAEQELVVLIILLVGSALLAFAAAFRSLELARDAGKAAVEQAHARRQLGVYVPEEVVELALQTGALGLDGEQKSVAVLFVDLRNFTEMCVDRQADEVVEDLNAWLHEVVEVIQEEKGTVDKYIGDCVMAVFGMVEEEGNEASRALRSAARIAARMKTFNAQRCARNEDPMRYGVGLHYGLGIVGSMGGAGRLQYTVIGDVVNRASRLEEATKHSDASVLLSQELYQRAVAESGEELPAVETHAAVRLKGIPEPVEVMTLSGRYS